MPNVLAATAMFGSSFAPLFIVFGLLRTFGDGWQTWVCYAVAGASVIGLIVVFRVARELQAVPVTVARARHRDSDAIGYVVTYLLPFATLGTDDWRARGAILIFLAVVAVLYIQAGLFYVNPLLNLARYRIYEVETPTGRTLIVISRKTYLPATDIRVKTINNYVSIEEAG